jgi:nicotinate-nucleotide pyrophosphorylase
MTTLSPLPDVMLRPLIEAALLEDLGRAGDITTDAIIPPDVVWKAKLNARQAGVVAGMDLARASIGHLVKVELEVDSLEQLDEALALYDRAPIDAVLLDNMTPDQLRQAVAKVGGRFPTEASGRVTVATVAAIAATGVDVISAGWITHSAPVLDIGLDI